MEDKITIITGTGRAGTSFLMALLTYIGLPTGFGPSNVKRYVQNGTSGFELPHSEIMAKWIKASAINETEFAQTNIRFFKSPDYVLNVAKFANFCSKFQDRLNVIIPVRSIAEVSSSRYNNSLRNISAGGLHPRSRNERDEYLLNQKAVADIFVEFSRLDITHTTLWYRKLVTEPKYVYTKLESSFQQYGVDVGVVEAAFRKLTNMRRRFQNISESNNTTTNNSRDIISTYNI